MKKSYLFLTLIFAALLCFSCSKKGKEDPVNPNPTKLNGVSLICATIAEDTNGFNMISNPGFENYPTETPQTKTLWYIPDYDSYASVPFNGLASLYVDCNVDGWRDACFQTIPVKKNKSYTMTMWMRGAWNALNVYMGFRYGDGSVSDHNTNTPGVGVEWTEYTHTWDNTGDNAEANAFTGGWCWYNLWLEYDNFKVIPTGTELESYIAEGTQKSDYISNASFTEISSVNNMITWIGQDDKISIAASNVVLKDKVLANCFITSKDFDYTDNFQFLTVGETEMITPDVDEIGCIPTAGITIGESQYVHYYSLKEIDSEDSNIWTINFSGLLRTTDKGKTWSPVSGAQWAADGGFAEVAYCKKGDYIYMYGTSAGRTSSKIYVARVTPDKFEEISSYQYWDGSEWVSSNEKAATGITYGPSSEMSVVYNNELYTYQMIYRSVTSDCLVYRDAGSPEGEWSGEKLFMKDPTGIKLASPSVLKVSADEIYMIATNL